MRKYAINSNHLYDEILYYSKEIKFKYNSKSTKVIIIEKGKKEEYVFKDWKRRALEDAIYEMHFSYYYEEFELVSKLIFLIRSLKIIKDKNEFYELISAIKGYYVSEMPETVDLKTIQKILKS